MARLLDNFTVAEAEHLTSDPSILGGEPVIKGTRISCRAVMQRLDGNETLEDLCEDYPEVSREAFVQAATYAREHPELDTGPDGRPWRKNKPVLVGKH